MNNAYPSYSAASSMVPHACWERRLSDWRFASRKPTKVPSTSRCALPVERTMAPYAKIEHAIRGEISRYYVGQLGQLRYKRSSLSKIERISCALGITLASGSRRSDEDTQRLSSGAIFAECLRGRIKGELAQPSDPMKRRDESRCSEAPKGRRTRAVRRWILGGRRTRLRTSR